MVRWTSLLLATAFLGTAARPAVAGEADARKILGTWIHKAQDNAVTLVLQPDTFLCSMTSKEGFTLSLEADYLATGDGVLLGILRGKKGDKEGLEKHFFYCRFKVSKDSLVLSDVACRDEVQGRVKELVEGKYRRAERASAIQVSQARKQRAKGKQAKTYSSDPNSRIQELIKASFESRQIDYEWERIWFTDQPSHLTPEQVHGGILDAPVRCPSLSPPAPKDQAAPVPSCTLERVDEPHGAGQKPAGPTPVFPVVRHEMGQTREAPPTVSEILEALQQTHPPEHSSWNMSRWDDIQVTTELFATRTEPARHYPGVGLARLHHCCWKCTVHYTGHFTEPQRFDEIGVGNRYRPVRSQPCSAVVYIDKDYLHCCPSCDGGFFPRVELEGANRRAPWAPSPMPEPVYRFFDGFRQGIGLIF